MKKQNKRTHNVASEDSGYAEWVMRHKGQLGRCESNIRCQTATTTCKSSRTTSPLFGAESNDVLERQRVEEVRAEAAKVRSPASFHNQHFRNLLKSIEECLDMPP